MARSRVGTANGVALALNSLAFAMGGAGGFFLAVRLNAQGALSLSNWVGNYLRVAELDGATVSAWAVLWDVARWPMLVWLMGFTALGVWMIPPVFALRGFFLSFSVAGLAGAMEGGIWLASLLFGLGGSVTLPILFLFGVQSWVTAVRARGKLLLPLNALGRKGWTVTALGWTAVLLSGIGEYYLIPPLLERLVPLLAGQ